MARTWLGCTTSVDLAQQQQQHNTTSLHGIKRSFQHSTIDAHDTLVPIGQRQRLKFGDKTSLSASKIFSVNNDSKATVDKTNARQHAPFVPGPSQNPLLSLVHPKYGLPETLVNNLDSLGINSMYPWQSSCLLGHGLLNGSQNLVYTAPTGGGKSLVADILMLKKVIGNPTKKAILVLPYVALVQEKLKWLRRACEGVQKVEPLNQYDSELPKWCRPYCRSLRVAGFFGGSKTRATWADVDIAVCTIEKVS